MPTSKSNKNKELFLKGGGEMGQMMREKDWSETPIGDPASWPQSLQTMVAVMLENPFGMYIAWGKEYTQIYNDGYRPILGTEKHPKALGTSTKETYPEIFEIVAPIFNDVIKGKPVSILDFELQLNRNGYLENCFFDVSYSPIRQEDGTVGGILTTIVETTNKKKAIAEIKESESRFRTMAEHSDILIAISDESAHTTYFNKAWVNLTGKSVDDLIKTGWLDLIHPEDKDRFSNIYFTSFKKRIPFNDEFRILSKDGEYRWLLCQGPPRFRPDGSFAGYISSSLDITERKKTEEELKENKNQLQFAIDAAELATFDYIPQANKFSGNSRLRKWLNLLPNEELNLEIAIDAVTETDREKVRKAITRSLDYSSGGSYDLIYTILNPHSKKERIIHAKGKAFFDESKTAYRLNGILEDITDEYLFHRKIEENEQIVRNIVELSPAGICVLNSSTLLIEMVNEQFLTIAGKSSEIIGMYYWNFFDDSRKKHEAALNKVIETGIPYFAHDVESVFLQNGKEKKGYATFVFAPLKNDLGETFKVAIWSLDNTLQVQAIKKIKASEQEIRSLVESAPFPIGVFTGREMRIVLANQSILDAWGKGNDVIGKLFTEILPEFSNQQIFNQLDNVFTTGIPLHKQNQLVNIVKEGELEAHYFNYSLTPLFDSDGNIYGVMNTAADVTELNEAKQNVEAALQEIKLFKFMADNAADPFILLREDGSIAYLNKSGMKKWGYPEEELMNLRIGDIDMGYSGDKFKDLFKRNLEGKAPSFETMNKSKSGFIYPVEVSVANVHLDGEHFMFALSRDITERKKAEQDLLTAFHKSEESEKRFRDSVEQAPFGIAVFRGTDYTVELANEVYLNTIDQNADTFIGHPFFETHPELETVVKPLFKQVISTGQPVFGSEFPVILNLPDGPDLNYFNFVYHPLKEESGDISGIMVVATEVTTTVKAKHLLEETETNFRNMVVSSPIGMTILKADNLIIDIANKVMMESIWNKTAEEVIGKPILEVFPELNNQHYPALLRKVLKSGITHSEKEAIIFVNKRTDKPGKLYLDFEFAPLNDGSGNITRIMITANDVTNKVEARKKVEDAEERLRLATEATGISTWDLDLENGSIIHSQRLAVILGHPEITILTHRQIRQHIHPEDAQIQEAAFSEALQSGLYNYESRIIRPDGSIIWIRTQGRVFFDEKRHPVKMLGTLRDITDERNHQLMLEESESKFRLLSNALAQQVWLSDPEGNLYYFNQTVNNFSGLTNKQLIDFGWLEMIHPEDRRENIKAWRESISTGKEFLFEHRLKRSDGEYRWQLSRALPQKDAAGNIQMWVGSSTDIQEIKEQEQQKDLFISIASHELKTPLTSIKGYVQILQSMKSEVESDFLERALGIIDKQVNKLTQLIAELLDVSKIKSGGLDFETQEFEMTELIHEVVTEIKHINPQFDIIVNAKEQIYVIADRSRIGQVLINFLNNAVKYSPKSMLVNVSCFRSGSSVTVSVEDSGIGIDKREQENIFQRFYRVEGTNETTFPGFGIGLYISSEIIQRHNGKINVISEYGKGSVFSFEIPLKQT